MSMCWTVTEHTQNKSLLLSFFKTSALSGVGWGGVGVGWHSAYLSPSLQSSKTCWPWFSRSMMKCPCAGLSLSTPRTNQLLLSFFKTSALSGVGWGGVGVGWHSAYLSPSLQSSKTCWPWFSRSMMKCPCAGLSLSTPRTNQLLLSFFKTSALSGVGWGGVGVGWHSAYLSPSLQSSKTCWPWFSRSMMKCPCAGLSLSTPKTNHCCSPSLKPQLSLGWGGVG